VVIGQFRQYQRRRRLLMFSDGGAPLMSGRQKRPQDDSPDQAAMRSESICLIKAAIDKLPHDLKTAILLYEYQSLSHAEIASVLSCSVKAVEMKLYRVRQLLRERLVGKI
jgi:RNA polymerase sigma factor (sigma-70 family)